MHDTPSTDSCMLTLSGPNTSNSPSRPTERLRTATRLQLPLRWRNRRHSHRLPCRGVAPAVAVESGLEYESWW
jgi:hypothetical protein